MWSRCRQRLITQLLIPVERVGDSRQVSGRKERRLLMTHSWPGACDSFLLDTMHNKEWSRWLLPERVTHILKKTSFQINAFDSDQFYNPYITEYLGACVYCQHSPTHASFASPFSGPMAVLLFLVPSLSSHSPGCLLVHCYWMKRSKREENPCGR